MTIPPPPEPHAVIVDAVVSAANAAAPSRRARTDRLRLPGTSRGQTVEPDTRDLQHFRCARRTPLLNREKPETASYYRRVDVQTRSLAGTGAKSSSAPADPGRVLRPAGRTTRRSGRQ